MPAIQSTASFPRGLLEGVKVWWGRAAKSAPDFASQMYKKEMYYYHMLRKNTEEGNLNYRVAKDWLPAQREIFSSPA